MFMSAGCPMATEAVVHLSMPCTPQPERPGYVVGCCIPICPPTSRFGVIRRDYDTRATAAQVPPTSGGRNVFRRR